jgi:hypothetical protein
MGSAMRQFHHGQSFELYLSLIYTFKWPQSFTEKYRHNVDVEFISRPCCEALLCGTRGTNDVNIFVAGSLFRLPDGAFNAIGHESKG